MSNNENTRNQLEPEDDGDMLDADDADEEIQEEGDVPMDSDGEEDEVQLQNDSIAHFDTHSDSILCIAQHPVHRQIIATGGVDEIGYIIDVSQAATLVSPSGAERPSMTPLFKLEGHTDSINAIAFTQPKGEYLVTAGLDGRVRAWKDTSPDLSGKSWKFIAEAREVEEINWLNTCTHPDYPNTIAFGAGDGESTGSVWVYTVDSADKESPLTIVQSFYIHTAPCHAGAWTPDGKFLATVSEDGSFYVWDVFGEGAAAGVTSLQGSQSIVGLTAEDERFRVEGGLYSVAVSPNGAFAAVGGAGGQVRIVGMPRVSISEATNTGGKATRNIKADKKGSGQGKSAESSTGQAGSLLASLQVQSDTIETIAFSQPPLTLMATGSIDGSIALFDTAHRFATRRHIKEAHEEEAVIQVDFIHGEGDSSKDSILTSCGNDGVVRRWDARGGTAAAAQGLVGEWRGHRGGGEGGGIMGFIQSGNGKYIATAGDDGVCLVFDAAASA